MWFTVDLWCYLKSYFDYWIGFEVILVKFNETTVILIKFNGCTGTKPLILVGISFSHIIHV